MDAHRLGRDVQARLAGEELRHARFEVDALAEVLLAGGVHNQQVRGLHLRRHVGELLLYRLVLGDGLAERVPLLRVLHRGLERGARHADRPRRDVDASQFQPAHDVPEAFALCPAEQVRCGGPVVLERDLCGLDSAIAELGDVAHDVEARTLLPEEDADAAVRRVGVQVGLADDGVDAAVAAVGDEHLAPVHDIVVAVADGARLDGGHVRARVRLGDAEGGAPFALRHDGQEALLLVGRAEGVDHVRDEEMRVQHTREAHPALGQLLDEQGVGLRARAAAAVLLRDGRAEEPELAHLRHEGVRVLVGEFEFGRGGHDFPLHEIADGGDERALVFGQLHERLGTEGERGEYSRSRACAAREW